MCKRLVFRRHCEISTARLNFVPIFRLDFNFAEAAVLGGVRRNVANVVLASKFLRNLVESCFELVHLVPNLNYSSTSLRSQLLHLAVTAIATEAIEPSIGA